MNIRFNCKDVMNICNYESEMVKNIGFEASKILKRRLFQLSAADNLSLFAPEGSPPEKCTEVSISNKKIFQININRYLNLFFYPLNGKKHEDTDKFVWDTVSEVCIHAVEKFND